MIKVELKKVLKVKQIVLAADSGYKKHNAYVSAFPETAGISINSYWDGGSRDYFTVIELATMKRKEIPNSTHPYFDLARHGFVNLETPDVVVDHVGNLTLKRLPKGFAVFRTGVFCGKTATAHVYLSIENYDGNELSL